MYRRILVPTDGSEGASAAFDHAIELATLADAAVHVVNAVDPTLVPAELGFDEMVEVLTEAGEEIVEALGRRGTEAGIPVETAVVSGPPATTICQYVEDHDIDLVVMGTHGRTGLDRWLLGSVAERVVRTAPVPVLTVQPPD